MFDRLKIWLGSKLWFWNFRAKLGRIGFVFESRSHSGRAFFNRAKADARIVGAFAWVGVKSLVWVALILIAIISAENLARENQQWITPLSEEDKKFNIDQLRLYAQILTAIFSIYFATIGIILSAGYTKLRRDIIYMLTNEQVGSVYSKVLVLAAMFCLAATALPSFGRDPGLAVYVVGTVLTLLSALALFPLGQRLFNFFDLNVLIGSEILPSIARHIDGAANAKNSTSLAHYHSRAARQGIEQLCYIDDRAKTHHGALNDSLSSLTNDFTVLLLHYLKRKHKIAPDSHWFPRRRTHKRWFFAGDSATTLALQSSNQQILMEEKANRQWLEDEVIERLAAHVELAFSTRTTDLALRLLQRFGTRASVYAAQFQFSLGMQEVRAFKAIIERAASELDPAHREDAVTWVAIADAWAALGSSLCLESLRRIITFDKDLRQFFSTDEWSEKSLRELPVFMQVELAGIVARIEFEKNIEGQRLSRPKYLQQLAVQKYVRHCALVVPQVVEFYTDLMPEFVDTFAKLKMSEAATQVVLASLHSHWKLPRWLDELAVLFERYREFEHYTEAPYAIPNIDLADLSKQVAAARDSAIARLGSSAMVGHIFETAQTEELPDHFGQIYFELAEACISALQENNSENFEKVLPMFMNLAFLAADSRFSDPTLDVDDEFRLHLISTAINDLASVLGFAILYGLYFNNESLSTRALARFDAIIANASDEGAYLKRMVVLSNPHSFSLSASPRGLLRINWGMAFEARARDDGFADWMGFGRGRQHPDKVIREFLNSHSDASHLFFAKHVLPKIDTAGLKVDHQITHLSSRLRDKRAPKPA